MTVPPRPPRYPLRMPNRPPKDPADHAADFAHRYARDLDAYYAVCIEQQLGIPERLHGKCDLKGQLAGGDRRQFRLPEPATAQGQAGPHQGR
jgi:hypothetical protein